MKDINGTKLMGPRKCVHIKRCSYLRGVHNERFHCNSFWHKESGPYPPLINPYAAGG